MNQTKDIQTVTSGLSRLLESRDNLHEFHDALWDAGIKLEPALMDKAKRAIEIEIQKEIARVKGELKELL